LQCRIFCTSTLGIEVEKEKYSETKKNVGLELNKGQWKKNNKKQEKRDEENEEEEDDDETRKKVNDERKISKNFTLVLLNSITILVN
jgi:hypothetical protein